MHHASNRGVRKLHSWNLQRGRHTMERRALDTILIIAAGINNLQENVGSRMRQHECPRQVGSLSMKEVYNPSRALHSRTLSALCRLARTMRQLTIPIKRSHGIHHLAGMESQGTGTRYERRRQLSLRRHRQHGRQRGERGGA